ncbi:MAG TPA: cupin domain-containing protein [Armatimonadota bacterium]|nr:cupin domain-containing protein [Armatimonadota bacterium]
MSRAQPICRRLHDIEPVSCPCGESRRIITAADDAVVGLHVTSICDAAAHYHRRTIELYYVLEGSGLLTVHGSRHEVAPGLVAYIPPGCVHRGEGDFTAAIVCLPPFSPEDEFLLEPGAPLPCPRCAPVFRRRSDVEPVRSACGSSTRIITRDDEVAVGLHVVHIREAERHYHTRITEVYHILEGVGRLAVGEQSFELEPGVTVYIPAGLTHGGEGDFTSIVICVPPFDPADQIVV